MVQTFSTDRADHAFHISALPWRSWSAKNFFDVHDFNLLAELASINAISIPQQIFRCAVERKRFDDLLCGPFCSGMSRDVEVDDASAIVPDNDEDEQDLEQHGRDREEVNGSQLRHVIVEERAPCL